MTNEEYIRSVFPPVVCDLWRTTWRAIRVDMFFATLGCIGGLLLSLWRPRA